MKTNLKDIEIDIKKMNIKKDDILILSIPKEHMGHRDVIHKQLNAMPFLNNRVISLQEGFSIVLYEPTCLICDYWELDHGKKPFRYGKCLIKNNNIRMSLESYKCDTYKPKEYET